MNVAVSGDRECCLSTRLWPDGYVFAVANGFGQIDGAPAAELALQGLRHELERRARSTRLRKQRHRSRTIVAALRSAIMHVNNDMHARSASHEDYVTAAASLTVALLIGSRVYLAHVGSTAAYLSRNGLTGVLTREDAFEDTALPVLLNAFGLARFVEPAISVFTLVDGDALVLAGRPLPKRAERIMITYTAGDAAEVPVQREAHTTPSILIGALATLTFYALLCLH